VKRRSTPGTILLLSFAAAALSCGCASGSTAGPGSTGQVADATCPTTTADIQRAILVPRCGKSGCHVGEEPAQGLDLASDGLESRIVGVIGTCGRPIVTAGKPDQSYLITKVSRRNPSCGAGMPFDGTVLSAHDVSCLTQWVEGLSPPDEDASVSPVDGAAPLDAGEASEGGSGGSGPVQPSPCPDGKMRCGALCIATITPTFDSIYTRILSKSCVFTSCHGGIAPKEHLGMDTASLAYQNLVSQPSQQRPELLRVAPSHPELSYMVDKLHGQNLGLVTTTGLPSERMPQPPSTPLCDEKITLIEDWIRSGAAQ
jgi:hypothetical protein